MLGRKVIWVLTVPQKKRYVFGYTVVLANVLDARFASAMDGATPAAVATSEANDLLRGSVGEQDWDGYGMISIAVTAEFRWEDGIVALRALDERHSGRSCLGGAVE